MTRARFLVVTLLLGAFAPAARAEFPETVPDRFRLRVGVFFADLETELESRELDAEILEQIDLEEDLELPGDDDAFRIDGSWRIGRRTSLDFGYLEFSRSAEAAIARTITFEGFTFVATGLVRGSFDSVNPYVALRYDFVRVLSFQLGASLGVDSNRTTSRTRSVTGTGARARFSSSLFDRAGPEARRGPTPTFPFERSGADTAFRRSQPFRFRFL